MTRTGEGSNGGGRGGGSPWIPPDNSPDSGPTTLLIPSLTASASNSPPLAAPYVTPPTLYAGQRLSAAIANRWLNNNNWLWGVGIRTHDTQTGFMWVNFEADDPAGDTVWKGYFQYAGVSKFLHGFHSLSGAGASLEIYVTDDTGEHKIFDSTSLPTAATALSFASIVGGGSTSFTVGEVYQVRVVVNTAGAAATVYMDFLAVVTANALSWPSLVTLADGTTPSATDLNTISTAENYLYNIGSTPTGSSVKYILIAGIAGSATPMFNGCFFMYGRDAAHVQNRINVRYKFTALSQPVMTICAIGSTVALDTINLAQDGVLHNDSYALTVANYAPDTFYRIRVVVDNAATGDYIERITIGGALALSNPGVKLSHLDNINGVGGLQNIGGSGATMNLAEIRTLLHGAAELQTGAGTDTGFQFIAPDQSGTINAGINGDQKATLGNVAGQASAHRPHVWRVLRYLTAAGTNGTLNVGGSNNSLPDTAGAWDTYDLQNMPTLAYGMDYTLVDVVGAFETIA